MRAIFHLVILLVVLSNAMPSFAQGQASNKQGYSVTPLPDFARPVSAIINLEKAVRKEANSRVFSLRTYHCPSQTLLHQIAYHFEQEQDQFKRYCHTYTLPAGLQVHQLDLIRDGVRISILDNPQSSIEASFFVLQGDTLNSEIEVCWTLPALEKGDFLLIALSGRETRFKSEAPWSLEQAISHNNFKYPIYQLDGCRGTEIFARSNRGGKIDRYPQLDGSIRFSSSHQSRDSLGYQIQNLEASSWDRFASSNHFSTFRDWASVASHFRKTFEMGLPVSDTLRQLAHDLTQDLPAGPAQAEALWEYVTSNFALVQANPYNYRDRLHTLKIGGGNQISVGLLLNDLLRALGFETRPVLVREQGFIRELLDFPASHYFDHLVIEVDFNGQMMWLDLLGEEALQSGLPSYHNGLPLAPGTTELQVLPATIQTQIFIRDEVLSLNAHLFPEVERNGELIASFSPQKAREFASSFESYANIMLTDELPGTPYPIFRAYDSIPAVDRNAGCEIYPWFLSPHKIQTGNNFFHFQDELRKPIWDYTAPDSIRYTDTSGVARVWTCQASEDSATRQGALRLPNPFQHFTQFCRKFQNDKYYSPLEFPLQVTHSLTLPKAKVQPDELVPFELAGPNLRYRRWVEPNADTLVIFQELTTLDEQIFYWQYDALDTFVSQIDLAGAQVEVQLLPWKYEKKLVPKTPTARNYTTTVILIILALGLCYLIRKQFQAPLS